MKGEGALDELVSLAAEALYEDEAIRSNLEDREASFLLAWAQGQLEIFARSLASRQGEADPAELFNAHARRIRRAARGINALVGDRDSLSNEEFSEELNSLLSGGGAPRVMPQAAELIAQRREMDPLTLVARLASLATESWQIRGGGQAALSGPSVGSGRPLFQFGLPLLILALVLIAAAVALYFILRPPQPQAPAPPPVPQGTGWYQVHFTAPLYPDDPSRHQGSLDQHLTAFINTATSTVDMAIYELDLANVTGALLEAKNRGTTVRVVTSTETMEDARESRSFKQLQSAGIQVVAGNPNAIMHDKFVVVDGAAVWTGSWNFTDNDTYRYNNNGVLLQSQDLARNYTVAFEKMWRDKQFGRQKKSGGTTPNLTINGIAVESYFSPEDRVAEKVAARLRSAQSSIDFMAFSFTEDQIGTAVRERATAGVKVRGVFERSGSETQFSEFGRMRSDGLEVLQDGNPYLMHHKVFVIDGRTVITGSFNFSANANTSNDENLLVVDDPAMAGPFTAEFERVMAQAKTPPTK